MAKADQLKALLKSHIDGDDSHFFSVAMQMAASEAKRGHGKFAQEIRALVDEAKAKKSTHTLPQPIPITAPRGELSSLLSVSYPKLRLSDMVLIESVSERFKRLIMEQRQIKKIRSYGLMPRKKLLLLFLVFLISLFAFPAFGAELTWLGRPIVDRVNELTLYLLKNIKVNGRNGR